MRFPCFKAYFLEVTSHWLLFSSFLDRPSYYLNDERKKLIPHIGQFFLENDKFYFKN
jgi:hypothetical protein